MIIEQFKQWLQEAALTSAAATPDNRYAAAFAEAVIEQYAKNSPGQLGLFGNGIGGDTLRRSHRQQHLPWDESKHPRASDGRFGNKPGVHSQHSDSPRKEKTPEQTILGKRAGDAKVLGAMLYDQLDAKEPISLLGQKVTSAEDVAQVAQVYRDPRYETLRAFFVKDGVIIGQNAYSSRHPAAVAFPPNMIEELGKDIEALEADGFYLLHNHPSGVPDPSPEDIAATKQIHEALPGKLLDHVIIDHNKGAIINTAGETRYYDSKNEDLQDTGKATVPNDYLGTLILSSEALGDLAMQLNPDEDRAVMVFTSVKGHVRMLVDVGTEHLTQSSTNILGAVRRAARASNSDRRFLVLPKGANPKTYDHLMAAGVVTDIAAGLDSAALTGSVMGYDPIAYRIKGKQTARERFAAYFAETFAEQYQAITTEQKRAVLRDQLADVFAEHYAAGSPKNSPGQLGLFGDGLGSQQPLRRPVRQQRIDWDESKHPRDAEGKFTEKGQGTAATGKKPKKPFVYPSGETQEIDPDGKPTGDGAPTVSATPESEPTFEDSGDDLPEDASPRDRAAKASIEHDPDYEFARPSTVPNAGEDLKGSARHKVNAWRSLDDAENDGTAEELVTRDQLLKNEPHELAIHVDKEPITTLLMHEALRAFPPKPGYGSRRADAETQKLDRNHYLQAYRDVKKAAEEIAASGETDPRAAASKLAQTVKSIIERLRREHGSYNNTANGLVNFHNRLASSYKKTALVRSVGAAVLKWKEKTGLDGPAMREPFIDAVHEVLGGKSLSSVMGGGSKGGKPKTFNPADLYVAHASREGGPSVPAKTAKEANDFLVSKVGFRGVQYGNSVSDKEREHHATMAAAAMVDLADITGLPLDAVGFGGKLGLAIGARGRSSALAHYEPGTRVINLTRKKGVGSLAHEWAHALDHEMAGGEEPEMDHRGQPSVRFHSEEIGYARTGKLVDGKWVSKIEDRTNEPKFKAMAGLRDAMRDSGFVGRLPEAMNAHGISGKRTAYWTSKSELFARCFERFAQRKLEKAGRKNTYLSGIETQAYKNGGLWPTNAEVDQMAPHFEALLAAHRKEAHGLDEPVKYSATERQFLVTRMAARILGATIEQYEAMQTEADRWLREAERYRASSPGQQQPKSDAGRELVRGEQGDLGYYITVDGHPVFVEARSGTIRRGPRHLRDQHIDAVPGKKLRRSKRIKSDRSGDRNSPGQKGMFGNGIGGDTLRDPKTQSRLSLGDSQPPADRESPDSKKFTPKTRIDRLIVDEIGDDPEDVRIFRDMLADAHKMLLTEAHEINDDLRNLLSNFGYTGKRTSQIIQTVRRTGKKGGDHDQIVRFDEMADMARRSYPRLLAGPMGESVGYGDNEHALMERLKQGFETLPSRTDERVFSLAREIWDRHGDYEPSSEDSFADDWGDVLDDDPVPFAAAFALALVECYMATAASQSHRFVPANN